MANEWNVNSCTSTFHPLAEHSIANSLINTPISNCLSKMFSLAIIVTPNSEKMLIAYNQLSSRQSIKAPHHTLLFTLLLIGCVFLLSLSPFHTHFVSFTQFTLPSISLTFCPSTHRTMHSAMVATLGKNKRVNYERMMDSNGIFYKPIDYVWNDAQLR